MASSFPNGSFVVRAAVILTTAEVAGATFDLNMADRATVEAQIDFTLGSLTNGIFRFYVSQDGTNFYQLRAATGAVIDQTLTANATIVIPVLAPGSKFLRISVQGTGTVTSSSAAVLLRYLKRGSQ